MYNGPCDICEINTQHSHNDFCLECGHSRNQWNEWDERKRNEKRAIHSKTMSDREKLSILVAGYGFPTIA